MTDELATVGLCLAVTLIFCSGLAGYGIAVRRHNRAVPQLAPLPASQPVQWAPPAWSDTAAGHTPISAERLNRMDAGASAVSERLTPAALAVDVTPIRIQPVDTAKGEPPVALASPYVGRHRVPMPGMSAIEVTTALPTYKPKTGVKS